MKCKPVIPVMRLSHKLAKIRDPRAKQSMKVHFGRALLTRRPVFHFNAGQMIATINREKFETIRKRYAVENPGTAWPKFVDLKKWMAINVRRVRDLRLDYGRRRDVLDIGSGAGYFLYLCQWLGHRVMGLDLDKLALYREMTELFSLNRVVHRIEAFEPLPDLGRKFDVITAFMVCFNNHERGILWGVPEWNFFLTDVAGHLKPKGRLWLELNRRPDGSIMNAALRELFEERGARIEGRKVIFDAPPRVVAAAEPREPQAEVDFAVALAEGRN